MTMKTKIKNCILCNKNLSKWNVIGFCKECMLSNAELNPSYKGGLEVRIRFCKDCGKELHPGAKYQKTIRCYSCANKSDKNPMFGIKGELHYKFKKNKPKIYCIDCSKELSALECQRCWNCYVLWKKQDPKNHPQWKGGNPKCINCSKEISWYAKRCVLCSKIGKNNPNWIDGRSFEKYPLEFNEILKEQIRSRDNYTCQNCGMTEEEHLIVHGQKLHVHHIDYNKKNCNKTNLITVCLQCNLRANYNRNYWQEFYKERKNKQTKKEVTKWLR